MIQLTFSEKRLAAIVEKAVNNSFAAQKAVPEPPYPDWDTLDSIVQLADFLECSYSTAKRLKLQGHIKFNQQGTKVRFSISDIIDAIHNDDRVGKYADRFCENHPPAGSAPIPKKDPKIRIETELFPEKFMFIKIKYQGWGCTVCTSPELWDNQPIIRDLVNQVIKDQNNVKPFKISPNVNN